MIPISVLGDISKKFRRQCRLHSMIITAASRLSSLDIDSFYHRCNTRNQYESHHQFHRSNETRISMIGSSRTATNISKNSYEKLNTSNDRKNPPKGDFIGRIEETINNVKQYYQQQYNINIIQHNKMEKVVSSKNLNNDEGIQQRLQTTKTKHIYMNVVPPNDRETINIVRYLYDRIQSMKQRNICLYCWFMKDTYCICSHSTVQQQDHIRECFILPNYIQNIYIITHHKEIGLVSDTMKLLLLVYSKYCSVVIGNIPEIYQSSLQRMNTSLRKSADINTRTSNKNDTIFTTHPTTRTITLVLFPSKNAQTFASYFHDTFSKQQHQDTNMATVPTNGIKDTEMNVKFDIIVIDATWEQARRLYNRHIIPFLSSSSSSSMPNGNNTIINIQLSDESLVSLQHQQKGDAFPDNASSVDTNPQTMWTTGQQLRPHPIPIREIATAHAVQLLIHDIVSVIENNNKKSDYLHIQEQQQIIFDHYQQLINDTATEQAGKVRWKSNGKVPMYS